LHQNVDNQIAQHLGDCRGLVRSIADDTCPCRKPAAAADARRRLGPVNAGHLQVHQNQIEFLGVGHEACENSTDPRIVNTPKAKRLKSDAWGKGPKA